MEIPTVALDGVPQPLPEGLVVLDVREPAEWTAGHVEGAIHIPLMEIGERWGELPDGQTLVVCRVGGRSAQATGYLAQQGVDAVNLEGGLVEWAAAGRPLVSETSEPPRVV